MTHLLRLMTLTVLVGSICACESKPVEETVWDDQIDALDKARDVEETLMNRADQMSRDLEGLNKDKDEEDPQR